MGCKISIKIHPEGESPKKHLSPYKKFLKTIEPVFIKKRGNPNISKNNSVTPSPNTVLPNTVLPNTVLPNTLVQNKHYGQKHGALFVGIDKYVHWPQLNCAVEDATALSSAFSSLGFSTQLLVNQEATNVNIQEAIEHTMSNFDVFVIAFFGHGIAPAQVGGMFIPVDAGANKHAYDKIHASDMRALSERSKSTSGLFILDFCYSGAFLTEKRKNHPV